MNTVSRRGVLGAGVGVAGLSAIALAAFSGRDTAGDAAEAAPKTAAKLVRSRFARSVGETFTAVSATATHRLVLASIDDVEPVIAGQSEQRFNLIFTAAGSAPAEDIYTLTSDASGESYLLLSPFGPTDGTRTLQALVNSAV